MFNKFNMGIGLPHNSIMNEKKMAEAFNHAINEQMDNKAYRLFNYGTRRGDLDVIESFSKWYSKQINCFVNPNNLYYTFGCSQAVLVTSMAVFKPGDNILMECPSFFAMADVFYELGLNLYPAERSLEGNFNFKELEESIVKNNIKGMYLVTNYHNPLGVNLSLDLRVKLYELAHKYKIYIISDDIYELLYFNEETREVPLFFCDERTKNGQRDHLATFDNDSSPYIISVGSLNKTICPSIRFGFFYCHSSIIEKVQTLGLVKSSMGFNPINTHVVNSFIKLGYIDENVADQRKLLKENTEIACEIFKKGKLFNFTIPQGGYFIFVKLDSKVNADKLASLKTKYEFSFLSGYDAIPDKLKESFPEYKQTVRLSISFLDKDLLKEACERFIRMTEESAE